MGSCMSSKAGSKKARNARYTTVPAPYKKKPIQNGYQPMTDNSENESSVGSKAVSRSRAGPYTRGQSTLFGFKRRPVPAPTTASTAPDDNAPPTEEGRVSPRPARGRGINRFGFKQAVTTTTNRVADSNANSVVNTEYRNLVNSGVSRGKIVKPIKAGTPPVLARGQRSPVAPAPQPVVTAIEPGRFTLQTSLLPAPQFPIRLQSSDQEVRTSKGAKTAANNSAKSLHTVPGSESSSSGSLNADSGIGSQRSGETDQDIPVLQASPGSANRRGQRQQAMRRRELEVVLQGKTFDVRDAKDDLNVITEISVISLPTSNHKPAMRVAPQPSEHKTSRGIPQPTSGATRDRRSQRYQQRAIAQRAATNTPPRSRDASQSLEMQANRENQGSDVEKSDREKERDLMPGCWEEYGPGEAMAEEYSYTEDGMKISNIQPRPIHLAIEEARFAAIAAGESSLIDDEKSPVDSLMSSSLPSSEGSEEGCDKLDNEDKDKSSPQSPGSPTNASNSLSLSEGRDRDFLIDDEIADQPGLVFDEEQDMVSSMAVLQMEGVATESSATLVEGPRSQPQPVPRPESSRCSRAASVDTLSPCESLASDDLMINESDVSDLNAASRVGSQVAVNECDFGSAQMALREWSTLLRNDERGSSLSGRSSRLLRSTPDSSPASGSPLRPPRGPRDPDDAGYVWLDRQSYQAVSQDIVAVKTMLLRLKRLFQEAETLNPFDNTLKQNGLYTSLAGGEGAGDMEAGRSAEISLQEEVMELRRQTVFLQQQLDDRDRTVKLLQLQMTKYTAAGGSVDDCAAADTVNAATQTERMRPVSTGPSLLQGLPAESSNGSLVSSSSDSTWRHRKTTPINARRLTSPAPRRRTGQAPTS